MQRYSQKNFTIIFDVQIKTRIFILLTISHKISMKVGRKHREKMQKKTKLYNEYTPLWVKYLNPNHPEMF